MIVIAQFNTATRNRILAEISPRPFHFRREETADPDTLVRASATEA